MFYRLRAKVDIEPDDRLICVRWPASGDLPSRVAELSRHVEAYYESGENSRQRVL